MKKPKTERVLAGLTKLAFGRVNDAVRLAFAEELPSQEELDHMNLFNVASIKRVKGGGVEIQFFDRQKALERLYDYASVSENNRASASLLEALTAPNTPPHDKEDDDGH